MLEFLVSCVYIFGIVGHKLVVSSYELCGQHSYQANRLCTPFLVPFSHLERVNILLGICSVG